MNQLIVPSTGLKLVDGSIVMLARYPGTKWIVHNGWYTFNNQQSMGWYFCSIPSKLIVPANDEDLNSLTLVSEGGQECPCPPYPPHPHPYPPHPQPPTPHPEHLEKFTESLKNELDAAFISVDTIADRNALLDNDRKLPNGKLVRVNYIDDSEGHKYYRWDANNEVWKEESFGIDDSKYVTKEQLVEEVSKQIDDEDIPGKVEAAIQESESIKEEISSQVQEIVPTEVEKSTLEIKQDLDKISSDLEWEELQVN